MRADRQTLRIAALIAWFELAEDEELSSRIKNELWCLRNNVDTTALSDLTVSDIPTSTVLDRVFALTPRTKDEQSAFIVCTMHEIS